MQQGLRTALLGSLLALGCEATIGTPTEVVQDAAVDAIADVVAVDVPPCAVCSVWEVRCGDRCVDLTVDPESCGACGARCDGRTQVCRSGVCANVTNRCASVIPSADAGVGDGGARDGDGGAGDGAVASNQGLRGEYYAGTSLTGLRAVRVDPTVDFDWSMATPAGGVTATAFSARWVGSVRPLYSERYTFIASADDGVRLWVDDQLLVDDWTSHAAQDDTGVIELVAFRAYSIKLEYFNGAGAGSTRLSWMSARQARGVIPASALTPGTGVDEGCDDGVCCPAGGTSPVCCPGSTRCVINAGFAGCCPVGEPCGEVPMCTRPAG